jgi:hypothetical protein
MTALAELQRQMARAVRADGSATPIELFRPDHLPAGEPLSVYRNHHCISLCSALGTTFPTVSRLIGEEAFDVLARQYLRAHAPGQPCLSEYGADFADYLERAPLVKDLPYLADVSRLDWAINRAATAPDAVPLGAQVVGSMNADQLANRSIAPHPSLTLLRSQFPLPDIYRLAYRAADDEALSLNRSEVGVMIWRQHDTVTTAEVSLAIYAALAALATGAKLIVACEMVPATDLPAFFSKYVLTGAFAEAATREASMASRFHIAESRRDSSCR